MGLEERPMTPDELRAGAGMVGIGTTNKGHGSSIQGKKHTKQKPPPNYVPQLLSWKSLTRKGEMVISGSNPSSGPGSMGSPVRKGAGKGLCECWRLLSSFLDQVLIT